jgi:hypothetical protein
MGGDRAGIWRKAAAVKVGVGSTGGIEPDRIMEVAHGFWAAKALFSAVELDLFTVLAGGALHGETLRQRLGMHERGSRDFFDALVALGLLERDPNGRYANSAEAELYLDRGKPTYVGAYLEMLSARTYRFWDTLGEALRTGLPQSEPDLHEGRFRALHADAARSRSFVRAMTGGSLSVARAIAAVFPWRDVSTIVDIGTAQGCLPVEIALAHSHVYGSGFDLPQVRSEFEAYVEARGLADRLRFHSGDFLRDELPSADVLVMGRVLHNWDLATKKLLLAKAYDALPTRGALIVYDRFVDDERRANATALLSSVNMLVMTPSGFDYTGADCLEWMREAGFRDMRIENLSIAHGMAIGWKR